MTQDTRRIEFGDWQTPDDLANQVLRLVLKGSQPRTVLEPTCGQGSFLAAAALQLPDAKLMGYDISPSYVEEAQSRLPAERSTVVVANFFEVAWEREIARVEEPLLVIGNPPWVTNAELGALGADNLPIKANFKRLRGLDAMTGKGNFDISEWMILRLIEATRDVDCTIAMLCKASVARRVMEHTIRRGWGISGEVRGIDAQLHFGAAVDAVLLQLHNSQTTAAAARDPGRWPVFDRLDAAIPERIMAVVDGRLCSDLDGFIRTQHLAGSSSLEWRSGLKHDCSKVMELDVSGPSLVNGFGEPVELEQELVFPLLKGSDVANQRLTPRKAVVVPQRQLGEDTRQLATAAPRLWEYLNAHRTLLDGRKSSIYQGQPPFAIFGIGDYSFAPYKVAICGLYKRLTFTLIEPIDGKPVMLDDTVYFLPCATAQEAYALMDALSSDEAQEFFNARIFWDTKRPITKSVLQTLSIEALLASQKGESFDLFQEPRQQALPF